MGAVGEAPRYAEVAALDADVPVDDPNDLEVCQSAHDSVSPGIFLLMVRSGRYSFMAAIDGVSCAEPEGAFYCFPDVSGLLGRSLGGRVSKSSSELADVLLETIKIAVVPGEAFGTPGFFRLSYALGDDDIVEGLERFGALVAAG